MGRLRHQKELTQMELAEKAEISHRYLQSLEAGRKLASIEVAGRLKTALACSWDELMKGV